MQPSVRRAAAALALGALALPLAAQQEPEPPPATLEALAARIDRALAETGTPGAGVALFDRERTLWARGFGVAQVASGRRTTPDTLFRIGSITKSFVALAVLMLVEEGELALDARVADLAPEVAFANPWEATDPVRLVHLLEHTAGWDDLALREYALSAPDLTLEQGLAYAPRSRRSRWRPGTRFSYCNSGPAVAARIVEKRAGTTFERFVAERIFAPAGLPTATFFEPDPASDFALLYHEDGTTPYPFWHVILRPAGSISASAVEMARYGRLLAGRGTIDGVALLSAASVERSERPATSWAARAGIVDGYGLGSFVQQADGFAWSGHDGGVEGGLARLAYLPDAGRGYVAMINSGSGDALRTISRAVRGYLTRGLPQPEPAPARALEPAVAARFAGWYLPDSPRQEMLRFLERLLGLTRLSFAGETLVLKPFVGPAERYAAVGERSFRRLATEQDAAAPLAGLALVDDPLEGVHLQTGSETGRKISALSAWVQIFVGSTALALLLGAPLGLLLQALLRLARRLRDGGRPGLWLWPSVPSLAIVASVALFVAAAEEFLGRFGNLTLWSAGFCAVTYAIPAGTLCGLHAAWRARGSSASRRVRAWAWSLGFANLAATIYLLAYGVVGLRTWR